MKKQILVALLASHTMVAMEQKARSTEENIGSLLFTFVNEVEKEAKSEDVAYEVNFTNNPGKIVEIAAIRYINSVIKNTDIVQSEKLERVKNMLSYMNMEQHPYDINSNIVKRVNNGRLEEMDIVPYVVASPLFLACQYENIELVKMLLGYGAEVEYYTYVSTVVGTKTKVVKTTVLQAAQDTKNQDLIAIINQAVEKAKKEKLEKSIFGKLKRKLSSVKK